MNAPKRQTSHVLIGLVSCGILGLCSAIHGEQADNQQLDNRLLGQWHQERAILALVPEEKPAVQYIQAYGTLRLHKDGTAELRLARNLSFRELKLRWRTHITEKGNRLEFFDENGVYLVARYEFRDDRLWIGYSLEPNRVGKEPPASFDCFREPSMMIVILERFRRKDSWAPR